MSKALFCNRNQAVREIVPIFGCSLPEALSLEASGLQPNRTDSSELITEVKLLRNWTLFPNRPIPTKALSQAIWWLFLFPPFVTSFRCRTVALETGMQNAQLCTTIVQLSFSQEQLGLMFTFPLIYSIFQLVFAGIILGGKLPCLWPIWIFCF